MPEYPDINFIGWIIVYVCIAGTITALISRYRSGRYRRRYLRAVARDRLNREREQQNW